MTNDDKILDWFGFKHVFPKDPLEGAWESPEGIRTYYPPTIDLNFLFEHSKKKGIIGVCFRWGDNECVCWLYTKMITGRKYEASGDDDVDAFKLALVKVIDND